MKIPEKGKQEGILEYAERISGLYARIYDTSVRKLKGQIFTPKQVSTFMASQFEISHRTIHLLDPGAGTGILTAAFCERILNGTRTVNLIIDAYENDPNILPLLRGVLMSCKAELEEREHHVEYNIYKQDFILHNADSFRGANLLLWNDEESASYDFVISNPPYYKLNKGSPQSAVMMELVSGQPNVYALFMALSASMVKLGGEMVFISPRSFCSGLYYKRFREWFLSNTQITDIHIFQSRKEIFDKDGVLQENIIIKAKKPEKISDNEKIVMSISQNRHFDKLRKFEVQSSDVICPKNGETFIRIPISFLDVSVLRLIDTWPNTLRDFGWEISQGPVIPFRAEAYLLPELTKNPESVPLLWMHNMQDMSVIWPLRASRKACAICVCDETMPLLLPVKNYVLVKRFSSKEQKRRLYASVLLASQFPAKAVGIENHVNYIHKPNGNLSVVETLGIAAILNTTVIDNFFRSLNGNTQVNATDIRSLPLPGLEDIRTIGKFVYESQSCDSGLDLDKIVAGVVGIN